MSSTTTTTTSTSFNLALPVRAAGSVPTQKEKSLPQYKAPSSGILSQLPSSWVPYAELTRLAKPTGIFNIFFPYLFGALHAAWVSDLAVSTVLYRLAVHFAAAFVLRSAGCSWNDIIDRDVDRQVTRCRLRPMARGAISVPNALIFTAAQTAVWLAILSTILPSHWSYTLPLIGLVMFYPFGKRLTSYAQVVLGLTLSVGVLIGSATMGVDVRDYSSQTAVHVSGIAALFASYTVWSVVHDTVYAQQDVKDDIAAGLNSMAVRYRHYVKQLLAALCVVQTGLLVHTGNALGAGLAYQLPASLGTAVMCAWMLWRVNTEDPNDCAWWFQNGCLMYGALVSLGLFAEYTLRCL